MPAPATPIAQTSKRRVSWKKESTFNTAAGASGATVARRTQINLNLTKQAIESGEKRSDFQPQVDLKSVRAARKSLISLRITTPIATMSNMKLMALSSR